MTSRIVSTFAATICFIDGASRRGTRHRALATEPRVNDRVDDAHPVADRGKLGARCRLVAIASADFGPPIELARHFPRAALRFDHARKPQLGPSRDARWSSKNGFHPRRSNERHVGSPLQDRLLLSVGDREGPRSKMAYIYRKADLSLSTIGGRSHVDRPSFQENRLSILHDPGGPERVVRSSPSGRSARPAAPGSSARSSRSTRPAAPRGRAPSTS